MHESDRFIALLAKWGDGLSQPSKIHQVLLRNSRIQVYFYIC